MPRMSPYYMFTVQQTCLIALLLVTITACSRRENPIIKLDGTTTTDDNTVIAYSLFTPPTQATYGVVLVHDEGGNRDDLVTMAAMLQQNGTMSITFDMRGHGESPTTNNKSPAQFTSRDWLDVSRDIRAAQNILRGRGISSEKIALLGCGLGANIALNAAADDASISAVVLVSPGVELRGVQTIPAITRFGKKPSLLLVSEGDSFAADSAKQLGTSAEGNCELREYPGTAHGIDLLDTSKNAREQIVVWLDQFLKDTRDIAP